MYYDYTSTRVNTYIQQTLVSENDSELPSTVILSLKNFVEENYRQFQYVLQHREFLKMVKVPTCHRYQLLTQVACYAGLNTCTRMRVSMVQSLSIAMQSYNNIMRTHCCRVNMAKQKLAPISGHQCSLPPLSLKYNTVFDSSNQMSPMS